MILIYLAFLLTLGSDFTQSMEVTVDKSLIELRLLLNATRIAGQLSSTKFNWREWDVTYVGCTLDKGLGVFRLPEYDKKLPMVILIHGLRGSAVKHSIHIIAMLKSGYRERFNLVALNMPLYFSLNPGNLWYVLSALRAKVVGELVGELLAEAVSQGLVAQGQVHVVGYSLGAQTAGYIARTARGNVASIVGLDPAGLGFDSKWKYGDMLTHVSKSDAAVVHMYHANRGSLGSSSMTGTADVVLNNGWHQPGCGTANIFCSHRRALQVFAQVISSPSRFEALRCSSYKEFQSCQCRGHDVLHLTFPPHSSATGIYYLETTGEFPYEKSHNGALCAEKLALNSKLEEAHKSAALTSNTFFSMPSLKGKHVYFTIPKEKYIKIELSDLIHDHGPMLNKFHSLPKWQARGTVKGNYQTVEENAGSYRANNENDSPPKQNRLMDIPSLKDDRVEENRQDEPRPDVAQQHDSPSSVTRVGSGSKWHFRNAGSLNKFVSRAKQMHGD